LTAAPELAPGAPDDAAHERLGPHDLEDVADVRQQDREVDQRQDDREREAPGGNVVDLDLGADEEGVED